MKTAFFAFILIALVGLLVLAYTADSSITGQGVKITIPKETLKKVIEEPKKDFSGEPIFTGHECLLFSEIYRLRKELNLNTDHLESTKEYCTKIGDWLA